MWSQSKRVNVEGKIANRLSGGPAGLQIRLVMEVQASKMDQWLHHHLLGLTVYFWATMAVAKVKLPLNKVSTPQYPVDIILDYNKGLVTSFQPEVRGFLPPPRPDIWFTRHVCSPKREVVSLVWRRSPFPPQLRRE
ncbi:hypothetical protein ECG_07687 [Echinococcus granulosus]|nr:hypothetical protein ECG_07687 [Echinococcus granulosus]